MHKATPKFILQTSGAAVALGAPPSAPADGNQLLTGTIVGPYNGVFEIRPAPVPGDGIARQAVRLLNKTVGPGTTQMDLLVHGNAGIGTPTPSAVLHLKSAGGAVSQEGTAGPARTAETLIGSNAGCEITEVTAGNVTHLFVSTSGNVGLGVPSPDVKLRVAGNGREYLQPLQAISSRVGLLLNSGLDQRSSALISVPFLPENFSPPRTESTGS